MNYGITINNIDQKTIKRIKDIAMLSSIESKKDNIVTVTIYKIKEVNEYETE